MLKAKIRKLSLIRRQEGFAAFAVTMIMIVVLSLIVLGFAFNSRSEQRRAFDKQLNTQAYYAAESGINYAYSIIKADYQQGITPPKQIKCDGGHYGSASSHVLHQSGKVGYTCLLVDPAPPSLEYSPIAVGHGQVVPVFGQDSSGNHVAVSSITVSWQKHGGGGSYGGCPSRGNFPKAKDWPSS
jgi:hypothetical protein